MNDAPHILVADDDPDIRSALARYLKTQGLRVSTAENAEAARRQIKTGAVSLIVLDIMMPGEDGLSLCRHLRETADIPIILLTAMVEETDRIVGLEMGADDYVTKPFSPRELYARIKAVLRRAESLPPRQKPPKGNRYAFGPWTLNAGQRELIDEDGVAVALSTGEFRLLMAFIERPRMVLSREQLLDMTQGREAEVFDRSIDNQVSRLRRKIEADPSAPRLIKTVWGGGYSFAEDVKAL